MANVINVEDGREGCVKIRVELSIKRCHSCEGRVMRAPAECDKDGAVLTRGKTYRRGSRR